MVDNCIFVEFSTSKSLCPNWKTTKLLAESITNISHLILRHQTFITPEGQNKCLLAVKLCLDLLIADNFIEICQMLIILCRHYNIIIRYRICFFQNSKAHCILDPLSINWWKNDSFFPNMTDNAKIKKVINVTEQEFYPFNLWWANQRKKSNRCAKDNKREYSSEDLVVQSSYFLPMKFI